MPIRSKYARGRTGLGRVRGPRPVARSAYSTGDASAWAAGIGAGVAGAAQLTATFYDMGAGISLKQAQAAQTAANAAHKQAEANYLHGLAARTSAESSAVLGQQFLQTTLAQEQLRQQSLEKKQTGNFATYALLAAAAIVVILLLRKD